MDEGPSKGIGASKSHQSSAEPPRKRNEDAPQSRSGVGSKYRKAKHLLGFTRGVNALSAPTSPSALSEPVQKLFEKSTNDVDVAQLHHSSLMSHSSKLRIKAKVKTLNTFADMRKSKNTIDVPKTKRKAGSSKDGTKVGARRRDATSSDRLDPPEDGRASSRRGSLQGASLHVSKPIRRGSHGSPDQPESTLKKEDSLEKLIDQMKLLRPNMGSAQAESDPNGDEDGDGFENLTEKQKASMSAICSVFAGKNLDGKPRSLKDVALAELSREVSIVDSMSAGGLGKHFLGGDDEAGAELLFSSDEDEKVDLDAVKKKIKNAKPRYMRMFQKPDENDEKGEEDDKNPSNYGFWDTVSDVKILQRMMRARKEWHPPDWEQMMEKLREEGRDNATIDADLKEISHQDDTSRAKTGKYLMPEDLTWCRKYTKFRERDLLKWFRKFRSECPKGTMDKKSFQKLFGMAFPLANVEAMADLVFEILDFEQQEELDFKDFCLVLDAVNSKTLPEKLRWAFHLFDQEKRGALDFPNLKVILPLLDQVEQNGFVDGVTDEELDELLYRRKDEPMKGLEERAEDVYQALELNADGKFEIEAFTKVSERIIFAKDWDGLLS